MNELQIFNHPDFGQVRTYEENGKVLFCGVDVAFTLGYSKPRNALAQHCRGALKRGVQTSGGMQEMIFISESDLYRLVFGSKLPAVDTAMKALSRLAEDHWQSDMDKAIKELNADVGWSLPKLRGKLFAELEQTVNCNLSARTRELQKRKKRAGMRAKDANLLGKLDAIAADKQLRAIF